VSYVILSKGGELMNLKVRRLVEQISQSRLTILVTKSGDLWKLNIA
jgi:hypothetical protein